MRDFENFIASMALPDPFYDKILGKSKVRPLTAILESQSEGRLAGVPLAQEAASALGIEGAWRKRSGQMVRRGEEIARFRGPAESILKLENLVIGLIAKPSGIATAAAHAVDAAEGRVRLVSGGWKKHPFQIREMVREAVAAGGMGQRISDQPFLYLDKNYVRIFGGIGQTLQAVAAERLIKIIQVRGEFADIAEETREAIRGGASVVMVDTGSWEDLDKVLQVTRTVRPTAGVRTAFAGGIQLEDIPALVNRGVDIADIGAAILDAPWLELTYDVVSER